VYCAGRGGIGQFQRGRKNFQLCSAHAPLSVHTAGILQGNCPCAPHSPRYVTHTHIVAPTGVLVCVYQRAHLKLRQYRVLVCQQPILTQAVPVRHLICIQCASCGAGCLAAHSPRCTVPHTHPVPISADRQQESDFAYQNCVSTCKGLSTSNCPSHVTARVPALEGFDRETIGHLPAFCRRRKCRSQSAETRGRSTNRCLCDIWG
jgi:hypothetical protein